MFQRKSIKLIKRLLRSFDQFIIISTEILKTGDKMSMKKPSPLEAGREIKRPTLHPHQFTKWWKEYAVDAMRDFGNAGEALRKGKHYSWRTKTYREHIVATTNVTLDQLNALTGVDLAEFSARMKKFIDKQAQYELDLRRLYADILQHLSVESNNLLTKDTEAFRSCQKKQDPIYLMKVLKQCHSQIGRQVSDEEKRVKRLELESLKQWDRSGKVIPLPDHDRAWQDLYEEAKHIGVQWDEKELVRIYLRSVDSTHIFHDLSAILKPDAIDFPKSVVEASYWVSTTLERNRAISESQPGKGRYKDRQSVYHANDSSNKGKSAYLQCVFCEKTHPGGAQECSFLLSFKKDNPKIVKDYLSSKSKKRKSEGDTATPEANNPKRKKKGTTRKTKQRAKQWKARQDEENPHATNAASAPKKSSSDTTDQPSDMKSLMQNLLKLNKLGDFSFYLKVTPLQSYTSNIGCDKSNSYMLDNGSNCSIMGNRDLVYNVRRIESTTISGMGSVEVTEVAQCIFGPCYIADIPFNIISEAAVMERFSLTFDSTKSPHYIVGGDVLWRRGDHGLLWLDHEDAMTLEYRREIKNVEAMMACVNCSHFLEPLIDNVAFPSNRLVDEPTRHYSADERRRAKQVKNIHDILGHPNDNALGILFDSGAIHGCPYTSHDIRVMRKIYGPCVACIKGKTVAPTEGTVINKWLAIRPGERLCTDIYFITVMSRKGKCVITPLLIVVDDYTGYLHVLTLPTKTLDSVRAALLEVIRFYNHYDFPVREIRSDRENVFLALQQDLLRHPQQITLDAVGTDQHEKKAERAVRTLRDALRTMKAALWYKPPQFLYPHFCEDLASFKNCLPNRQTLHRTPRDIVEGRKLTQDQHLSVPLGLVGEFRVPTGTHVHTDPEKKEQLKFEERTATGIVVRRNLDSHGTFQVYLLETGRFVNRAKLLQERTHTSELKRTLEHLAPTREVAEEDVLRLCPKLSSRKRLRNPRDETRRGVDSEETDTHHESNDTNARGEDKTPEDESVEEGDELPPPSTVPVQEKDSTIDSYTDSHDHDKVIDDVDAMDTVENNSDETNHEDNNEVETRNPPVIITRESENTIDHQSEDAAESADTTTVVDTPKLPRKIRRLQKKIDDKRMKSVSNRKTPPIATPPSGIRYPKRINRKTPSKYVHASSAAAGNMSIKQAREKHTGKYREALRKELQQLHDKKVIEPIDAPVTGLKHSKVIGVKGFFKEKVNISTGKFEKLKFRLVPQGHLVDRSLYSFDETTSPTVALETVFATINLAAFENRRGFTMDIPGAYLNAELKEPHMVRFGVDLSAEYVQMYPSYQRHVQEDGTMLFIVKKAFYGLPESSALWYEDISKFLLDMGYKTHPCDKGLFVYTDRKDPKKSCVLCLWVDDILGWATHDSLIRNLEKAVIEKYDDARLSADEELQYIGMVITQPADGLTYVSQQEYIKKILAATNTIGYAKDPNHSNLFRNKSTNKMSADCKNNEQKVCKIEFASHLMMAMYLAKRTRPDILTPLSILATRMQDPDTEDKIALERVYKYVNNTKDYGLTYKPTSMELHYWSDAAYALHLDRRGHSGIMATLGFANAPIYVKSGKQKIHTRSSTESELVALDECILHLLWMRQIIEFLGYPQHPAFAYQDNKSTIVVCETGQSKNGKLKHMAVRYYFIHGQIEQNIVKIKYCKTSDMIADLLTKPLNGQSFIRLRNNILNHHHH